MKIKASIISLGFLATFSPVSAQKVGLVLSGGGAKGITHIGIIRALEENNIPIDYIAGTSMGAIVGSMYAMGYSPDEMERLLKSDDFKRWYSGDIEEKYIYYFKKNPPTPELINIRVSTKNPLKKVTTQILPSSVVNPLQMNLAFLELFAQYTATCNGDFDHLFVPFRCIGSDVYNKKALIFKQGDLGDAVRASMSFPAMFKPIEIDSMLIYDGGIYNNFPVNVMQEDFDPDVIIGSVVSSNPEKPTEGNIMGQLENMIMQKTDYSLSGSQGVLMTFNYTDVGLMDFNRYDELHNNGYNRTIELMDSIKMKVARRVDSAEINQKRKEFKEQLPGLFFKEINVTGTNNAQAKYIKDVFHADENGLFGIEEVKRGYFQLMSDNMISEVIPHAVFNEEDHTFQLNLKVKIEDELTLKLGGNVSSNGTNQMYLGATYQNLNVYAKELSVDGQLGQIYNTIGVSARLDLPTKLPVSFRILGGISTFDYFKQEKLFGSEHNPVFNKKKEKFLKVVASLPFMSRQKAEFSFGGGEFNDFYFQTNVIDFNSAKNDQSKYKLFGGSIALDGNTLNSRQFATMGRKERLAAHIYSGKEFFSSGIKDDPFQGEYEYTQTWLALSYELERYFPLSSHFSLGNYLKAYYSSRNFSQNYTATMMQCGEFAPTIHSKITYNEAFRANQFIGAGIMPVYLFNPMLQARLELYGFAPIYPIMKNEEGNACYGKVFSRFEYMGEISLALKLPFGSISAYVNHYSSPSKDWNIGLTLGWQVFGNKFFD